MNRRGFTLVELLVVIVIISLVGGIGIIAYNSLLDGSKNSYYKAIESSVQLASNEYFMDYRDEQPLGDTVSEVSISDLIKKRYMNEIKDFNGNECTNGKVYVYRENNNLSYKVCLECENYKSKEKFCKDIKN